MKMYHIRKVSKRRLSQLKEYAICKLDYLKQNPKCECCERAKATQIHHIIGREGKRLLDKEWFAAVCMSCHNRIEQNRAWAAEHGFLVSRSAKNGGRKCLKQA